jgi:eukaryotic-like serine/threonine-protein kinase
MTEIIGRRCRHCGASLLAADVFCGRCGGSAEAPAAAVDPVLGRVRDVFRGELEIERELGRGGMAAVFLAFDPALQRRVAVKALLPEFAEDAAMAERFVREARTVAALQHPHVVSVFGVRTGGGVQAIVMEFVEGRSLDVVLANHGRMHVGVAALVLSQVAAGLMHAHDRGVVHRDVKPANVILDRDGRAVVSDFGIARRQGMPRLTGTGRVVGTLAYMSPEQRAGLEGTPAADQYAFGVMAFELLTGRLPFLGNAVEINTAHLVDDPPAPRSLRPEIPPTVEAMVLRMMSKTPENRFRTLRDAERLLRSIVPDAVSTTIVIAGLSRAFAPTGSAVFDAATSPISVSAIPAPRAGEKPVQAAEPARRRSVRPMPIVVALAVVTAALLLWRLSITPRRVPTPAALVAAAPLDSHATKRGGPPSDSQVRAPSAGQPAPSPHGATRIQPVSGTRQAATATPIAAPTKEADTPPAQSSPKSAPVDAALPHPDSNSRGVPAATLDDARQLAKGLVALLNKGQWQDVQRLAAAGGGDPAMRDSLIRLARSARDFAAGFDRVASTPVPVSDGFETEFVLDLEWRGGSSLMLVRAAATQGSAGWKLARVVISRPE